MESVEKRLMQSIKDMTELEVQELELRFGKFNSELKESYNSKISAIEENLNNQITFYGKTVEDCKEEKKSILDRYTAEFQKIYDLRKEQFFNIQIEIQEMQANQKIALANFKKIVDERRRYINSEDFAEYMKKKQEFKSIVENTLKHEEFDRYSKLLEELTNPLEFYQKKLVALVVKFDGYKALIEECEKKLEECINSSKNDFDEIVRFRNNSLATRKNNILISLFYKVTNKFIGNKKFEKDFIKKMNEELKDIEEANNNSINIINSQTVDLISKIEEVREALNVEFKTAIE